MFGRMESSGTVRARIALQCDRHRNTRGSRSDDSGGGELARGFMIETVRKFASLGAEIEKEKGDFSFFALFERGNVPDRWDLLVTAPWTTDEEKTLNYIVKKIKSHLGAQALISLARIIVLDPTAPQVQEFVREYHVEREFAEVENIQPLVDVTISGIPVRRAYILKARSSAAPVTQ